MSKNPHWARWIYSSAAKHFGTGILAFDSTVHYFVEGDERNTDSEKRWVEFRLDGPYTKEVSKDYWRIECEINLYVAVVSDHTDAFNLVRLTGQLEALFTCIPIFRTGDLSETDENDGTELGILDLQRERTEVVRTSLFGKVRPDTRLQQATIEGHYRMHIKV